LTLLLLGIVGVGIPWRMWRKLLRETSMIH
jgi:hypothetical protein